MFIVSRIQDYLSLFAERRRYRRTERMIANLPVEMRKDIGWPGAAEGVRDRLRQRADAAA